MKHITLPSNLNEGVSVGIVLSVQTGNIVLVKNIRHKDPKWRIPGGTIESSKGEDPKTALIRETREETGIQLEDSAVIPLLRILSRSKTPHYYHVFGSYVNDFSELNEGPTPENDSDAVLIVKEFPVEEATSRLLLPPHFMMLQEGIKKIRMLLVKS